MVDTHGVLEVAPSQQWSGVDGLWSTFDVTIGTPGQPVRLLPGTSGTASNTIWPIIQQGCTVLNVNMSNCSSDRGGIFYQNASSTWSTQKLDNQGLYTLPLYVESLLGLLGNDNAYYGFDRVLLGSPGTSVSRMISNQIISGIATNDFWVGILGLSPQPFNFTTFNDPVPSLLQNIRNASLVNSTSWAYTNGAHYRKPPDYGSLTFGGYDASRVEQSVQIPFYPDISRDLVVSIQAITYDSYGSLPLVGSGIFAFLDSLVSQIWLPIEVCQAFERAFNLTWDDAGYYFLSEETHTALLAENPVFTFTLGATLKGGDVVDIKLPYAAFDLNISAPLVNKTRRYFPLKRATDSSQYTLGRVFFQEAYVVADYDRSVFNVSQALPSNGTSRLVAIEPPQPESSENGTASSRSEVSDVGQVAGIVAGVVVVFVVGIVVLVRVLLKRRAQGVEAAAKEKHIESHTHDYDGQQEKSCMVQELDTRTEVKEMSSQEKEIEMDAAYSKISELHGVEKAVELPHSRDAIFELPT